MPRASNCCAAHAMRSNALRMVHEERARAGARAAVLGAVSRECCAALGTLGKIPNVRQRVRRDLDDERHHARFFLEERVLVLVYVPTCAPRRFITVDQNNSYTPEA